MIHNLSVSCKCVPDDADAASGADEEDDDDDNDADCEDCAISIKKRVSNRFRRAAVR